MALYGLSSAVSNRKNIDAAKEKLHRQGKGGSNRWRSWQRSEDQRKSKCGTWMTSGKWSFRAERDWAPQAVVDELDMAKHFLEGGKMVPLWAYNQELCHKCFPEATELVTCTCEHTHWRKKDASAMVG